MWLYPTLKHKFKFIFTIKTIKFIFIKLYLKLMLNNIYQTKNFFFFQKIIKIILKLN